MALASNAWTNLLGRENPHVVLNMGTVPVFHVTRRAGIRLHVAAMLTLAKPSQVTVCISFRVAFVFVFGRVTAVAWSGVVGSHDELDGDTRTVTRCSCPC